MANLMQRVERLEERTGEGDTPLLMVVTFVDPTGKTEPVGIQASPPHLPEIDRLPGESWEDCVDRAQKMIAHLPAGTIVVAIQKRSKARSKG